MARKNGGESDENISEKPYSKTRMSKHLPNLAEDPMKEIKDKLMDEVRLSKQKKEKKKEEEKKKQQSQSIDY